MREKNAEIRLGDTAEITSNPDAAVLPAAVLNAPVPSAGAFFDAELEREIEKAIQGIRDSTSYQSVMYWRARKNELISKRRSRPSMPTHTSAAQAQPAGRS